ncbi:SOLUTE CARRIER FAMILY 22 MEMBER [Salix purpurea]|uniref:SOLUTE CARRIER FAMILY 22 MEMBER n=1 Tax=Salix purpurea TaxID=77065 RepID=A0A9Q0WV23_SALPP|nr:SOLUTE CARRIER FAMILY 22 MEMBER [Salix purpurea]
MDVSTKLFTWSSYNKQPAKSFGLFSSEFLRCHEFRLLRRTSTWLLPGIAFYNRNLSRKDIFSAIGWIPPAKTTEAIQETLKENQIGLVIVHSLTFFFSNFGTNATTFTVTNDIFPIRLRSASHRISAASGKLGDIIGAFGFLYLAQNPDKAKAYAGYHTDIVVHNLLIVLGVLNLLTLPIIFLVPESMGNL